MTPLWRLRPHDPDQIAALGREAGVPPLIAHLLVNRGITSAAGAKLFLGARRDSLHDPELLPGVVEAAERIVDAVRNGRKIVIYGDYDVDGTCGTSILWACLKLAGAHDVDFYIPHRVEEGYGVNADALRTIVADLGAKMIITVDCGVTAVREAALARELGVEFIVTDHHMPGPEWPEADVVVHPLRPGGPPYPFPEICGAAVAFKLAWQICKSFGDGKKASPHLRDFLLRSFNLVALATVADVMPLEGENRVFVRHGLRGIVADDASVGLKALLQVSGMLGKDRLTAGNLSFGLAPRINAAGRLRKAQEAVRLLITDDAAEALELAKTLDDCNSERKEVERSIVAEARRMIDESGGLGDRGAIVVGKVGWHPGVIGIVAARLAENYHRPAIVVALTDTIGQGSARSVAGFDLHAALAACSDGLTSFGGHKAAAGLKIEASRFAEFAERFDHHCREALTAELRQKSIVVDAEVTLGSLNLATVQAIDDLEPYGFGNPAPMLLAERVHVVGDAKVMGETKVHMSCRFGQGDVTLRAVGWNMANRIGELVSGTPVAVLFRPQINEWNGNRTVQMEIKDFKVMEAGEARHARPA
jgi:single-stranded-DNA-specific exonuclease